MSKSSILFLAIVPVAVIALAIAYVLRARRDVRIAVEVFGEARDDLYTDLDRLLGATDALLFSFMPHDTVCVPEREAVTVARNDLFSAIIMGRSESAVAASFVELKAALRRLFERVEDHPLAEDASFIGLRRKAEEACWLVQLDAAARDMIVEDVRVAVRRIPAPVSRRFDSSEDGPHMAEAWEIGEG